MSVQSRVKEGDDFENIICEEKGWTRESTRPLIKWTGEGKSNFDKMKSVNLDPKKFLPIYEKSDFRKYDAIDHNGNKIEIKKYKLEDCYSWKMLSEPIFKVANRSQLTKILEIFECDDLEEAADKYNDFLDGVKENIGDDIIDLITDSFKGIQLEDGYVSKDLLEFEWMVKKAWKGFNRMTIMFRIRS